MTWEAIRLTWKANATVVDTISVGVESTETVAGLAASGDVDSFKVFAVRNTGSQTGSNTITRP